MAKSTYHGGVLVKASTLIRGDTIRDPRKKDRILIVQETGATIFARGLESSQKNHHIFLDKEAMVVRVTNATTETTIALEEGSGQ